jgi:hypothetical protein
MQPSLKHPLGEVFPSIGTMSRLLKHLSRINYMKKKTYKLVAVIPVPFTKEFEVEASSAKEAKLMIKRQMKKVVRDYPTYNLETRQLDHTKTFKMEDEWDGFHPQPSLSKKSEVKFWNIV